MIGDHSGTTTAYYVEARFTGGMGLTGGINRQIFTRDWTCVEVPRGPRGVPVAFPPFGNSLVESTGLLNYEAALAIQWWFMAEAAAVSIAGSLCWQTRIVAVEVTYSVACREVGVGEVVIGAVSYSRRHEWAPREEPCAPVTDQSQDVPAASPYEGAPRVVGPDSAGFAPGANPPPAKRRTRSHER